MSNTQIITDCEGIVKLRHKGKEFSMATVEAALDHCGFVSEEKPKPYIFKVGDVARSEDGNIRIIVGEYPFGKLRSAFRSGFHTCSNCQVDFESRSYVKIGVLSDYLPKDE